MTHEEYCAVIDAVERAWNIGKDWYKNLGTERDWESPFKSQEFERVQKMRYDS